MPSTKLVITLVCVLCVTLFIPGVFYWVQVQNSNFYKCVYGEPVCSLTVATYVLTIVTACAFVAAVKAARDAGRTLMTTTDTYALETRRAIAERPCFDKGHVANLTMWLLPNMELTDRPPFDEKRFSEPRHFDFYNLGRVPIIAPDISVAFLPSAVAASGVAVGEGGKYTSISLGSIPVDGHFHVTLRSHDSLGRVRTKWEAAFSENKGLDFYGAPRTSEHGIVITMAEVQSVPSATVGRAPRVPKEPPK